MNSREIILEMDIPFLPVQQLTAGDLELMYEEGRVRYIKFRRREILRMIYPALRDENWVTVVPELQNEEVSLQENGFAVSYDLAYNDQYRASIEITANNNELVYVMKGEALKSFKSKRVGLCVHHSVPPCAGKEVNIIHHDGKTVTYTFPVLISADWPFTDITSMQWKTSNAEARLDFEGDLFETEDQRNWTDDSYKTYSGPQYKTPMLDLQKGDTMMHKITLRVNDTATVGDKQQEKSLKFSFPKIGYSRSAGQSPLTPGEIELIKQMPFDHYRVDLDLDNKNWKTDLLEARKESKMFGVKISLAASFSAFQQAEELIGEIRATDDIENMLIVSQEHYNEIQASFKKSFPQLKTGFGTGGWFADLNGALPLGAPFDFVSFKVSPQVHQHDNRSILENLGSQHATIETLRSKIPGKAIYIAPVMFNHNGDDARMHTVFGAWWTVNAICNFAGAGNVSLFELKGPRGIIHDENKPSPVYRLLRALKEFKPVQISRPGKTEVVTQNEKGDQIIFHKKSTHE